MIPRSATIRSVETWTDPMGPMAPSLKRASRRSTFAPVLSPIGNGSDAPQAAGALPPLRKLGTLLIGFCSLLTCGLAAISTRPPWILPPVIPMTGVLFYTPAVSASGSAAAVAAGNLIPKCFANRRTSAGANTLFPAIRSAGSRTKRFVIAYSRRCGLIFSKRETSPRLIVCFMEFLRWLAAATMVSGAA